MLFGPIFFASIGLKTNLTAIDGNLILFCIAFVAVGLICKIVGCGLMGRLCRYN